MAIKGLDDVLKNLNREISKIEGNTLNGVKAAVIFVQGESQETVPHDQGPLITSAFNDAEMQAKGPVGRVGYTRDYAPFVHEMPATNNFTKIGTGPKFLEKAVKNNTDKIFNIIAKRARVK